MGEALLSNGIILILMTIVVVFGIIYCYYMESLSYYADERSSELEIILFIKNAQDEIEGFVRHYYKREMTAVGLWIVDCGSGDQTTHILERLSLWFPGLKLIFLSEMPLEICMQEVLRHINAPAFLIIDGTHLKCKEILKLTALLHVKKMSQ